MIGSNTNPKISFAVGQRAFWQNRIFAAGMRDRANDYLILLRQTLADSELDLATDDIHPPETAALVIDVNTQKWIRSGSQRPVRYLITVEPPVVVPDNWSLTEHEKYDKIFTWNDSLVDNHRYFLLRYAHNLGVESGLPGFADRQLSAMIIGFKASSSSQELYSYRFDTIRWFLHNHPDEFHLYGMGWPRHLRPPASQRVERFLSRPIDLALSPFYPKNICFKGPVADKVQTFRNYRFAFCYENTHSAPGYITEKIFDAFRAGCVPVYLGPPNANDHIPPDCFVDRRDFSTHEDLYAHLKGISAGEFEGYQARIRAYLHSPLAMQFTPAHFVSVLKEHILADLSR